MRLSLAELVMVEEACGVRSVQLKELVILVDATPSD